MIELGRRVVALAPNEQNVWTEMARAEVEAKQWDRLDETLQAWSKTVARPAAELEALRGTLHQERKEFAEAEKHWLAFLAQKPPAAQRADVLDELAKLCAEQQRWPESADYAAKAVAAEETPSRRAASAMALLHLHRWTAANAEMKRANELQANHPTVKSLLPQFERLQTFLPRIEELGAEIKSKRSAALLLKRARLFTEARWPALALDDAEQAMTLDPASLRARVQTGEAWLDVRKRQDAARLRMRLDLVRAPDGHVSVQALDQLTEADAMVALNPEQASAHATRANVLRQLHQYPLALDDARAALALDPQSADAQFEMARGLDGLQDQREVLPHLVRATELAPSNPVMWYYRGLEEAQRADFAAAIKSLTSSFNLRPSASALRQRALSLRRIGRNKEADGDDARAAELETGQQ